MSSRHALAAAIAAAFTLGHAHAAVITGIASTTFPGFSTGSIGPVGATPAPNNDNTVAPSPNLVPYTVFNNALGIIDVEFNLAISGGTTEVRVTQTLVNNTGTPWTGYRYELGFGTGAAFTPSTGADALDFDAPTLDPAPTSSLFATLQATPDTLLWSGGIVPSVAPLLQTLAIDLPDNLAAFNPSGLNRFTLRQFALTTATPVPEPATAALLAIPLAALARRAVKKKK